jgi:fatty acid/phospholipid biosynthesis enzyme
MAELSVEQRQALNDTADGFVRNVMYPDNDLYDAALMKWGIDAQLGIAVEECAEFIVASSKRIRAIANEDGKAEEKALNMMREECADALITLEQARRILGPYEVDRWKEQKLSRLRDRLGEQ